MPNPASEAVVLSGRAGVAGLPLQSQVEQHLSGPFLGQSEETAREAPSHGSGERR